MKTMKIKLILLLSILSIFISCSEDFLDENPKDEIYANNLYQNKSGFESSLNSVYNYMRQINTRAESKMTRGQLWIQNSDFVSTRTANINNYVAIGPGFKDGEVAYNWLYELINTTNVIIDRAEGNVDWEGTSEASNLTNKNNVISQARVARSWAYRLLIYAFGPVPLSVNEINGTNYSNSWSRNSIDEIKSQMKTDLKFAVDNLPLRGEDMTRINGAVARHFLGELYLSLGEFENALDVLKELCESEQYSLVQSRFGATASNNDGNHYMDIIRNPYASMGNTETFFVLANGVRNSVIKPGAEQINLLESYVAEYEDLNKMKDFASKYGQDEVYSTFGGYGKGRYLVTPYAVSTEFDFNLYNNNISPEGTDPLNDNNIDNWIWNNTDGRDNFLYELDDIRGQNESIRKYFVYDFNENGTITDANEYSLESTIKNYRLDSDEYLNNTGDTLFTHYQYGVSSYGAPSTSWKFSYPYSRKWEIDRTQTDNVSQFYSFHDVGYLRLADSYLLYAEAFMMVGNKNEAANWINRVRLRSNASIITASDVTLDFLLDERGRELINEEERRITLLRTGKLIERVKKYNPLSMYFVKNHHKLYPFPNSAIDANKDKLLDQNDGYGGSTKVDFTPNGYPDEGNNP